MVTRQLMALATVVGITLGCLQPSRASGEEVWYYYGSTYPTTTYYYPTVQPTTTVYYPYSSSTATWSWSAPTVWPSAAYYVGTPLRTTYYSAPVASPVYATPVIYLPW